jgi:hypothetical protein
MAALSDYTEVAELSSQSRTLKGLFCEDLKFRRDLTALEKIPRSPRNFKLKFCERISKKINTP